jgi:uncharacterized repeat protein (TIGR01451 family)
VAIHIDQPKAMQNRTKVMENELLVGLHQIEQRRGLEIVGNVRGLKVVGEYKNLDDLTGFPRCKQLLLQKWVEPKEAQIGDVVTFYIRYSNGSDDTIENIVISDSLSGRLEYVKGTSKTDRPANFTAMPNEADSMILRWEIDGKLLPGQGGIVTFKTKVR